MSNSTTDDDKKKAAYKKTIQPSLTVTGERVIKNTAILEN